MNINNQEWQLFTVTKNDDDSRLDRFIKKKLKNINQAFIEQSLRKGLIRVDGQKAKSNTRIFIGQEVALKVKFTAEAEGEPTEKQVSKNLIRMVQDSIIFKDENIIVINKPHGVAVQGGSKIKSSINDVLPYLKFEQTESEPKLVHRLDKDTSGVLVIARNGFAAKQLTGFFRNQTVHKTYYALVVGVPERKSGTIVTKIDKIEESGKEKRVSSSKGLKSISEYKVLDKLPQVSLLEMKPITGRTHQLRIHAKELGTPIIGDKKYGYRTDFSKISNKMHLHARRIEIPAIDGKSYNITAPIPDHMQESLDFFGFQIYD